MVTPVATPFDRTRRLLNPMLQLSSTSLPLMLIGRASLSGDRDARLAPADHPRRVLFERALPLTRGIGPSARAAAP